MWQEQLVYHFSNCSSTSSSSQPSIPPKNYKFWYCSRGRLLNNSSKTIGSSRDAWEMGKCNKKPITHAHSDPKRIQGVAPRPRPVRMLLSLCGSDLRSVVWWRGVSPEILATIELLSLGLLGGTMISLWEPKSLEACMTWPVIENQQTKHKRTLKKPFQRRRRPYLDIREGP